MPWTLTGNVTPRQWKDWLKALLAFVIAFVFLFSTWCSYWIQPRTMPNVVLVTIIQTPAKTVGNFLDTSFLLIICVCISSAIWAFVQGVAGGSYVGMAFILFIVVYIFSTLRALSPMRMFVPSLVGPLFVFAAISSVIGVSGKNTSNGQIFDSNFLISTINSYLIGIAICLVINVLIFPDFASPHVNEHFVNVIRSIRQLTTSILETLSGDGLTEESFGQKQKERSALVAKIQGLFSVIDMTMAQASAEVSYSYYSMKDYARLLKACKGVSSVLFSMQTSLNSDSAALLFNSSEFRDLIGPHMKSTWLMLSNRCEALINSLEDRLTYTSTAKRSDSPDLEVALRDGLAETVHHAKESILELEKLRPHEFLDIIAEPHEVEHLPMSLRQGWEKMLQLTFYTLASKELVKELGVLHSCVHCQTGHRKHLRLHVRHYLPEIIFAFFSHHHQHASAKAGPEATTTWGSRMASLKNFFLSAPSIFGLKLASASLCYLMVLYSQPAAFQQWQMTGALTTILVAISPSLGQTYLGLPAQILASSLGSVIAYAGVSAFGRGGAYGLTGFGAILGIPFFYMMLFRPPMLVLGLLTLLSFSNGVAVSYANRNNPLFASPAVYLYRGIAVSSAALTASVIFTIVLYPTLARRVLRNKLFEIIRDQNVFYRKILVGTVNIPEDSTLIPEDGDVKETRNAILSKLVGLEQLMVFASAEPRLEGKFPAAKYRAVITSLHQFLDKLECLRVSGGDSPFDRDVRACLTYGVVGEARMETQQTNRILMYIYASAMLTKQRMPPTLPNASKAREKLVTLFVANIMKHVHGMLPPEENPMMGVIPQDKVGALRVLSSEKWLRLLSFSASAREVSKHLDSMGPLLKDIFGVFPDVVDHTEVASLNLNQPFLIAVKGGGPWASVQEKEDGTAAPAVGVGATEGAVE